ncbi:unnamed protein product [Calypogeia fissa]
MHRYAAGGSSGIGSGSGSGGGGGGGPSSRETRAGGGGGSDSGFSSSAASSYGLSSSSRQRAGQQLVPYKLKCDKDALSARFGPPDFYPPAANCPEEVLNRDCCVNGYKELIDGIEEANEVKLSLTSQNYSSYWTKQNTNKYKEAIRKRLRLLNNALIRKRKAGQVYGVALTGSLLGKPGSFPELRTCGEDFRKKWIEDLSQRKRLRSLAEHVPHGYRRRILFETLIKHDVPLLRSTWFVKIMYLNQVRPMSIGMSAGGPDKSQSKRVELWTKDVLEYAQSVLEEFCNASRQSSTSLYTTNQQQQAGGGEGGRDGAEVDLQAKWRYMVRLAQWHHSEGLIHRTQLVDWVLKQLQEKESLEALELLLPVILKLIDEISFSQTHVRVFVDIAVHRLRKLCPSDVLPNFADQPHLYYSVVTLTELIRYLLLSVPDTFVALDCFPLPSCVCPDQPREKSSSVLLLPTGTGEKKELRYIQQRGSEFGDDQRNAGEAAPVLSSSEKSRSERELIIQDVVDGIQRRAASLAKAFIPGFLRNNDGKVVQGLDKALMGGDIQGACNCVFDEDFCSSGQLPDEWQADVNPGFGRTPSLLRNVNSSELFAIGFLCEWAVCEFRDSRGASSSNERNSCWVMDMSRVYMAVSVLLRRMEELDERRVSSNPGSGSAPKVDPRPSNGGELNAPSASHGNRDRTIDDSAVNVMNTPRSQGSELMMARQSRAGFFASAGPMHDLIVAWLDQHQLPKGESFECLQLLLSELVRVHLFWPDAYVRQLLCSGVLDKTKTSTEIARASRHKLILQHLPGPPHLEGSCDSSLLEATRLTRNERYLALHGFNVRKLKTTDAKFGATSAADQMQIDGVASQVDESMSIGPEIRTGAVKKEKKSKMRFFEIKQAIASLFQFPESCIDFSGNGTRAKNRRGMKRRAVSPGSGMEKMEGTQGCEECSRSKRSKKSDGKAWNPQVLMPGLLDEEDTWWLRKGQRALDAVNAVNSVKVEAPVKPSPKQNTRGRPKTARKTQSLAQLAAARIESSQGACSSSQTSDTKVHCPYHHRSALEAQSGTSQIRERSKPHSGNNIRVIGNAIRSLRFNEKTSLSGWLNDVVRNLLSEGGNGSPSLLNNVAAGLMSMTPVSADVGGSGIRWKINDEALAVIVYIMDVAHDFHNLVQFLLWLLPMAPGPSTATHGHGSRGISTPAWNRDNSLCEVAEGALLSYLRRYEGVLAAMDLLPQALRAGMQRAETLMAAVPGGRAGCSALLYYVCDLLKKYGGLDSVHNWEKNWKTTCDQRLSAELEALKAGDSEGGFSMVGMSSSGVGDERDDPTPQRLTGRLARVGGNMKEIVQRGMTEAVTMLLNKEREWAASTLRDRGIDRFEEGHQYAQRIVGGVMDAIRSNGSGAPQGDSALVATAVGFLVNSAGSAVANVYDTLGASNNVGFAASGLVSSLRCGRQVLQVHVLCLRLLKEALGDRHSRMIEVALASEANSVVLQAMQHPSGRASPIAFRSSPDGPENLVLGSERRYHISAAAVASLVAMVAVQGMTSLDRMVSVLKLRENLETLQIPKIGTTASGISRSATGSSNLKDHVSEANVYWFRVLIGDCRHVAGGLVADLLGEANVLGLSRMQRLMPLTVIFSPAYALFAAALRRQQPQAYPNSGTGREDTVLHAAIGAVNDVVAHEPFRDVCLRDTRALYLLLSSDSGENEYAAMLDMQGLDSFSKITTLVPLRARLFLHSLLDRGLPACLLQDDDIWTEGRLDAKSRFANEPRQVEQLVQLMDELQPATYHWQWVELRLLLNEQVLIETLETQGKSAVDAVHAAAAAGSDTRALSECEKTFTEVVLTRLLVRPDAAALYSEAVHSLGRHLEEFLILQVKWVLEGHEMLLGRKSLHQLLDNIANRQGFSVEPQRIKMRGWRSPKHMREALGSLERMSTELASPEEGEVAEGGVHPSKEAGAGAEHEGRSCQQFATEKALVDLALPCLARSSSDTCSGFAFELIKQMGILEQNITLLARPNSKSVPTSSTGGDTLVGKGSVLRRGSRGGLEGGSPGIGRKSFAPAPDPSCLSAGALQTSMWLRLQFLLPLLPIIHTDREPTARNMRQTLAPVLLRLLGTSVVQEAVESPQSVAIRDFDRKAEASSSAVTTAAGEDLFDRLLSVLHALLSSTLAVWLKSPRPTSKGPAKPLREVPPFDRETAERMQSELEHMQLPQSVRSRLRAALPLLPVSQPLTISAGPPQVSLSAHALINPVGSSSVLARGLFGVPPKSQNLLENNLGKAKPSLLSDQEVEVDPWMLLEDGVGSGSVGGSVALGPGEGGNLKACPWLKGTVRVRRNDLTYVGAVDEES